MTTDASQSRRAAYVGLLSLTGFWVLVSLAGALETDYEAGRDRVSALAAYGAENPMLVVVGLLLFGLAYLSAGFVLLRWVGTRFGAALMGAAAVATWVAALARIDCPAGAARCGLPDPGEKYLSSGSTGSTSAELHGLAVGGAYVLVAAAMLLLALLWWRRDDRRPRALVSAAALVTSLLTVPFWLGGESPGGAQRLWLGILSAWVVLVCVQPLIGGSGPEEAQE